MKPNELNHKLSKYARQEKCSICDGQAYHKVSEEILEDIEPEFPSQATGQFDCIPRHPYTAYVCCFCFKAIFGRMVKCHVE